MAGFDQTYDGLEDLILRDQFFITCDKPLQTFLKEKGKMTIKGSYLDNVVIVE